MSHFQPGHGYPDLELGLPNLVELFYPSKAFEGGYPVIHMHAVRILVYPIFF